ncbi:Protein GrpE [Chlamydiales bacterium SCGC AG-110-M15]|nr:Protein GrpE [Chlamydiales bacterium SCGC AG-110-M15]
MSENAASSEQGTENGPEEELEKEVKEEEIKEVEPVTLDGKEYQTLVKEAEEFKEKYWRLLAESENSRKRLQKERQEMNQYTIRNVLMEFLQPLDTFEVALNSAEHSGSDELKNWAMGFHMIMDQFKDILNNYNVKPFTAEGLHFDPHHHEAVETVETEEHPDGLIMQEFLRGYKMGDKTIRPARVKVAKTPKAKTPESTENLSDETKESDAEGQETENKDKL